MRPASRTADVGDIVTCTPSRPSAATPRRMEAWMRKHRLPASGKHVDAAAHRQALDLRSAAARRLTAASRDFPLTLTVAGEGTVTLAAAPGSNALGRVVAELYGLAKTDRLARLKACASEQCHWIFFDRSKPANRHWCSSNVCGNRQKTRDYRRRRTLGCT